MFFLGGGGLRKVILQKMYIPRKIHTQEAPRFFFLVFILRTVTARFIGYRCYLPPMSAREDTCWIPAFLASECTRGKLSADEQAEAKGWVRIMIGDVIKSYNFPHTFVVPKDAPFKTRHKELCQRVGEEWEKIGYVSTVGKNVNGTWTVTIDHRPASAVEAAPLPPNPPAYDVSVPCPLAELSAECIPISAKRHKATSNRCETY